MILTGLLVGCEARGPKQLAAPSIEEGRRSVERALQQQVQNTGAIAVAAGLAESRLAGADLRPWDGRSLAFDGRSITRSNQFVYDVDTTAHRASFAFLVHVQVVSGFDNQQDFVIACYRVDLQADSTLHHTECPRLRWPDSYVVD